MEKKEVWYPGNINLAHSTGHYSNTLMKWFWSAGSLEKYCKENHGVLVVDTKPTFPFGMYAIIGRVLADWEMQLIDERAAAVQEVRERLVKEREAEEKREEEARIKREEEQYELIKLGQKCKNDHGGVIEENRKLKEQLKAKAK